MSSSRARKKILVVDDEKDIVELVGINLKRNGYDILTAHNGADALAMAEKQPPDAIILDIMMPGMDGNTVVRQLKADARLAQIPVIMLTAKSGEIDVVVSLTLGADDYVTKPFSMSILLARLNTVLRRADPVNTPSTDRMIVGPLEIDQSKHEAMLNGEALKLTLTEFKLLLAIVSARGRVLTRDKLMDRAIGTGVSVTDRAIDVHVTALRKKLGDANWMIHTVRGVGYRLLETPGADD